MESRIEEDSMRLLQRIEYTLSSLSTAELIGRKSASGTPQTAKTASSNLR